MKPLPQEKTTTNPPSVLILGASGVLGNALVHAFRQKAYHVLGTGFRRAPSLQPALQLDATRMTEMPGLEKWTFEHVSRLDVMIHCIGITGDHLLARMSDSEWRHVLEVNLKSAYLISNHLLPRLVKQRSGHLIFVSSWAGRVGRSGQAAYAASKAGLVGLTQSIAREYASRGILANGIIPGVFRSPMTEKLSAEALEQLWEDSVFRQFSDLEETAQFIAHLAGMKGVTGQIFQLDGRIGPVMG